MRRDVSARDTTPPNGRNEAAKPSPKTDEGAVCIKWVRCSKAGCRCMQGGPRHRPYYARYWWEDGRSYKRYVPVHDAAQVAAACIDRRRTERDERVRAEAARRAWREVRALIREVEHSER